MLNNGRYKITLRLNVEKGEFLEKKMLVRTGPTH